VQRGNEFPETRPNREPVKFAWWFWHVFFSGDPFLASVGLPKLLMVSESGTFVRQVRLSGGRPTGQGGRRAAESYEKKILAQLRGPSAPIPELSFLVRFCFSV